MVGTKISGLTGGPSYCQPGGAGHASLSSTPLVPRGASASRREDTALAAVAQRRAQRAVQVHQTWFPIFACSLLVISARGHTPQASNHSAMRLLIWRDALTPSVARRCDTAEYRVQRSTSRSTPLANSLSSRFAAVGLLDLSEDTHISAAGGELPIIIVGSRWTSQGGGGGEEAGAGSSKVR